MTDEEAEVVALTARVLDVLNASNLDEPSDHAIALIDALASILASIDCRDCRRLTRKNIEEILPIAFDEAMKRPATQDHLH